MEATNKLESVINSLDEVHDNVNNIYEAVADGEKKEALKYIDEAIQNLKDFKLNLTKGDEK